MAVVSIKWASLLDPNKQPSLQDATGFAPVVPTPTFTSATTSSYTAAITGFDAQFTYTVSASAGSAVRTGGNVTVSGLTANQSSTLTVTAANTARDLSFSSAVAFLSLPATPTLTQTGQTLSSVTVTIGNYDAGLTYTVGSSAGSATRSGNAITVTGLTGGQTITVTATASNSSGNSAQGSVSASSSPLPVVTGGTLTQDSTYYYRTFNSSSTFSVTNGPLLVDVFGVAGGAGGGADMGWGRSGGGGGGDFFLLTNSSVNGNTSIVIGAGGGGGLAGNWVNYPGGNGSSTSFGATTATGGTGGSNDQGGSSGTRTGGTNGGSGAGAGANGTAGNGQAGGAGVTNFGVTRGGGGGSSNNGAGGSGGGGTGAAGYLYTGGHATENFGGGGGGGGFPDLEGYFPPGGNGSSGQVIVRYLKSQVGN